MFEYQEIPVRTVNADGEPWFCLIDVCKVLGMARPVNFLKSDRCDQEGVIKFSTPSKGGPQDLYYISEPNLYVLIGRSTKKEAMAFQRWITHELLPTLRRTGSYSLAEPTPVLEPNHQPETDPMLMMMEVCKSMRMEQIGLDQRVRAIEDRMQGAHQAIMELPAPMSSLPEMPLRAQCRQAVDNLCRLAGLGHREAWTRAYREYELRFRTNLTARLKSNGLPKLTIIEEDGNLDVFYSIIMGLADRLRRA